MKHQAVGVASHSSAPLSGLDCIEHRLRNDEARVAGDEETIARYVQYVELRLHDA